MTDKTTIRLIWHGWTKGYTYEVVPFEESIIRYVKDEQENIVSSEVVYV